jgi:hypothetical protein
MKALNLFLLMLLLLAFAGSGIAESNSSGAEKGRSSLSSRTTEANYVPSLLDLQMLMAPFWSCTIISAYPTPRSNL